MSDFAGKRVTVMGLGRFGGGIGVSRWLAQEGAQVLVTDQATPAQLATALDALRDLIEAGSIELRLGGHQKEDFTTCDLVVANPAIPQPWDNPLLKSARHAGVTVTTEIRLLIERIDRRRVIGITGTAGKSTTAAMTHHLLARASAAGMLQGRCHLGGNIGGSLLPQLEDIGRGDWVVLELSSAMLHWLSPGAGDPRARGWSPATAVITNVRPNHLDWHGTQEHYEQSKLGVMRFQGATDHCIAGEQIPALANGRARNGVPRLADEHLPPLLIPGAHNRRNALLAIEAACRATGIDAEHVAHLVASFPGLSHRLQLVAQRDGLRFYNDSKSTTPEATVLAVHSFERPARVHLIAGGYDKQVDLTPVGRLAADIAGLYTIGATGRDLAAIHGNGKSRYCETLACAITCALDCMKPHDVLLLSPGCASWDQFDNYEQRGEAFVKCVEAAMMGEGVVGSR